MKAAVCLSSVLLFALGAASADQSQVHHSDLHGATEMMQGETLIKSVPFIALDGNIQSVNPALAEKYGIEVISLRLTANQTMLDYRYRIVDADAAAPLHGQHIKPHLIHDATQQRFQVPFAAKVGSLRQTSKAPVQDRTYVILFANPGRAVQHGDLISILQSDLTISGLRVE